MLMIQKLKGEMDSALADVSDGIKEYEVALYDWEEAITRSPMNTDYIVTKVDLLLKLGRQDAARREIEEALRRGIPRGVLREWLDKCRK